MTLEMGKPLQESKAEIAYGAEFLRWFSEEAVRIDGRYGVAPNGAGRLLTMQQPVGPCLLITPWNFPLAMGTRKIGPAIAAGCTMVVKPAQQTPLSMLMLAKILEEAGLPGGVLNLVTASSSSETMSPLIADPRLRKLSFTGSTEVGRTLMEQASLNLLRLSMELGGNAPFLVFDDADIDAAVQGALIAKMRNIGEACTAANRFHVAAPVAAEFAEKLAERIGAMKVGRGTEDGVEVGPLIDDTQRGKVAELVEDAVGRGARVLVGGEPARRRRLLLRPDRPRRRPRRRESAARGDLRPGRTGQGLRRRGRGDRRRQRHRVRPRRLRLHARSQARAARRREARDRHGRPQPGHGLQRRGAVRRDQAVGLRPRGRARGHRGVPLDEVRRDQPVDPTAAAMRLRVLVAGAMALLIGALVGGCGGGTAKKRSAARPPARGTSTQSHLPGGIVGVMFDGPALSGGVGLDRQLDLAVASGVESLRVSVDWSAAEPYRSAARVPPAQRAQFTDVGGIPTRFAALDRIVGAAAARGLTVLPVVERTPSWDALRPGNPASPPASAAPFAAFLTALVKRYGPDGGFWAAHPSVRATPIRMWQIWNEPNFVSYWTEQPFAPGYVRLLGAAHEAIKSADAGAKVVLAGFADFSWQYLEQVYRVPGARRLFDLVAVHPYTAHPAGVVEILRRVRAVMDRHGDRDKPLLATEITWPSSEGKAPAQFGVSTTEAGQARRLDQLMPLLIADHTRLRLIGFYWYTWMGDESPRARPYAFDYAGLLKYVAGAVAAKPALAVFTRWALDIEHCRRKSATAVACA